jgi:hypothetical protein
VDPRGGTARIYDITYVRSKLPRTATKNFGEKPQHGALQARSDPESAPFPAPHPDLDHRDPRRPAPAPARLSADHQVEPAPGAQRCGIPARFLPGNLSVAIGDQRRRIVRTKIHPLIVRSGPSILINPPGGPTAGKDRKRPDRRELVDQAGGRHDPTQGRLHSTQSKGLAGVPANPLLGRSGRRSPGRPALVAPPQGATGGVARGAVSARDSLRCASHRLFLPLRPRWGNGERKGERFGGSQAGPGQAGRPCRWPGGGAASPAGLARVRCAPGPSARRGGPSPRHAGRSLWPASMPARVNQARSDSTRRSSSTVSLGGREVNQRGGL